MKDEIIIQNKFCTTANSFTHYINHEKFCNGCIERNIVPTEVSIKKKQSISLWREVFITDWEKAFLRRNKNH